MARAPICLDQAPRKWIAYADRADRFSATPVFERWLSRRIPGGPPHYPVPDHEREEDRRTHAKIRKFSRILTRMVGAYIRSVDSDATWAPIWSGEWKRIKAISDGFLGAAGSPTIDEIEARRRS